MFRPVEVEDMMLVFHRRVENYYRQSSILHEEIVTTGSSVVTVPKLAERERRIRTTTTFKLNIRTRLITT